MRFCNGVTCKSSRRSSHRFLFPTLTSTLLENWACVCVYQVVCKTFHGAGIVVPVDKNNVGYRELPETDGTLISLYSHFHILHNPYFCSLITVIFPKVFIPSFIQLPFSVFSVSATTNPHDLIPISSSLYFLFAKIPVVHITLTLYSLYSVCCVCLCSAGMKRICKAIVEAENDDERMKAFAPLQEMMTFVQFANDECDYGMGFELGIDLFCYGSHVRNSYTIHTYNAHT